MLYYVLTRSYSVSWQYIRYGEPVVKACINQKCHYVDITGETYVS